MAAYYLDEADARGADLEMQIEAADRFANQFDFVFIDPSELIPELEQAWSNSPQARYAGRLRAVRLGLLPAAVARGHPPAQRPSDRPHSLGNGPARRAGHNGAAAQPDAAVHERHHHLRNIRVPEITAATRANGSSGQLPRVRI